MLNSLDNPSEKLKIFTILETKAVLSMLGLLETKLVSSTMEMNPKITLKQK